MRSARWFVMIAVVASTVSLAAPAAADGGSFISFDETYYVGGGPGHGSAYVSIPERHQNVLERGPFYAYLTPQRSGLLREGRPLPPGTIRLGTYSVQAKGRSQFELALSFTVPTVSSGNYTVQLCNDPCTVTGFQEPLTGTFAIAATQAEADLMRERDRLSYQIDSLRWKLKRGGRRAESLQAELDRALVEQDRLEAELAAAAESATALPAPATSSASGDEGRPLVEAWALVALGLGALVVVLTIGLALVFSRRHTVRIDVPDTIEEIEELESSPPTLVAR